MRSVRLAKRKGDSAGVLIEPHNLWTVTANGWISGWPSATDSLYYTSGAAIVRNGRNSGHHIGQEADAYTWYEINRHVEIGLGFEHAVLGQYLHLMEKGSNFTYPYFALNFKDAGSTH